MLDPAAAIAAPSPRNDSSSLVPPAPSWRYMAWRFFFTKSSDLDLGYAFLIPFLGLFFVAWISVARGTWTHVSQGMWWALVTIVSTMVIATVPIARARILASRGFGDGMSMPYFSGDDASSTFSTPPTPDAR